jgi:hypothetical protein
MASDPAKWSTLSTAQYIQSVEGFSTRSHTVFGTGSSASMSINYNQAVWTSGPERVGYLQIRGDNFMGAGSITEAGPGMGSGFALDASLRVISRVTCGSPGCSRGPGYYGYYSRIPVILGTPLTLVTNSYLINQARDGEASTGGQLNTEFQFRLFEADGTTPVGVGDAQESSITALAGLALTPTVFSKRVWHAHLISVFVPRTHRPRSWSVIVPADLLGV